MIVVQVYLRPGPISKYCLEKAGNKRPFLGCRPLLGIGAGLSGTGGLSKKGRLASPRAKTSPATAAGQQGQNVRQSPGSWPLRLGPRFLYAAALSAQEEEGERGSDLLNLIKCKSYKKIFKERKAEGQGNGETRSPPEA